MAINHKVFIGDVNNTSPVAWVDCSAWVDAWPTDQDAKAEGQPDTLSVVVYSYTSTAGSLPVQPIGGMEVMFYDHNYYGTNLHRYNFAGKINTVEEAATIEGIGYTLNCEGFEREMNTHVSAITFDAATYPTDTSRVSALFAAVPFGTTWDAVTYVGGPFVSYTGTPNVSFNRKTVYDIFSYLATDPGPSTGGGYPIAYRRWYTHGEWADATNPGSLGNSITRFVDYYSGSQLAQETIPLTDDSTTQYKDYVADSFDRANSTTTLGSTDTSQAWSVINGATFGISSNKAYIQAAGSGVWAAVVNSGTADGYVQATFSTLMDAMRLFFRVTAGGTGGLQGFFVQNVTGAYQLQYYNGTSGTTLGTYATTPAAGDVVRATFNGSSIAVYINGVQRITATNSNNQTATAHGIGANSTGAGRFDTFSVAGTPAVYYNWKRTLDYTSMVNTIAISGPGSDPFLTEWDDASKVGVDTKTGRIQKTATTSAWDSGAISSQLVGADGGYVTTTIEDTLVAADTFSRPNADTLGNAETGGAWVDRTGTVGIQTGTAYPMTFGTASNCLTTITTGAPIAIVEAKLSTVAFGAGLALRLSDDANFFMFVAEPSSTRYALYRRQAGVSTLIGSYTTTPANGDVIKVSIEDNTFKCYTNGTFRFQVTDSFQSTQNKHGLRFFSTGSTARIDDFKVRVAYTTKAFGIGTTNTSTNYTDIEHGILINSDRTVQVVESGTLRGSATSYVIGDSFKVDMRPTFPNGQTNPVMEVRYYKTDAAGAIYLLYTSTIHPDPVASTYFVDTALYHPGALLTNMTMRYYAYSVYAKSDSVDTYGRFWAKDILSDDSLDSNGKRQARADAIFQRYAYPRDTFECVTMQAYRYGRVALVNNSHLGWVNLRRVIAEVAIDYAANDNMDVPQYKLTMGDKPYEYGDDEPLGFLLVAPDNDRIAPPVPTGLAVSSTYRDGPYSVAADIVWTRPTTDEQWVEVELTTSGQTNIFRYPAAQSAATIRNLTPSTIYTLRIRARDYNNNVSDWSPMVDFTTVGVTLPAAPPWAATPFPRDGIGSDGMAWVEADWDASTEPNPSAYIVSYESGRGLNYSVTVPGNQTYAVIQNLAPNVSYTYSVATVDQFGVNGEFGAAQNHTVIPLPAPVPPPGWDTIHPEDSMAGWSAIIQDAGTTAAISTADAYNGKSSMLLSVPASSQIRIQSLPFQVVAGRTYILRSAVKKASGTSAASVVDGITFYDKSGATLSSVVANSHTPNTLWVESQGKVTAPSSATYARRTYLLLGDVTGSYSVYFSAPQFEEVVDGIKLASTINYDGTFNVTSGGILSAGGGKVVMNASGLFITSDSTSGNNNLIFKDHLGNTIGSLSSYDNGAGVTYVILGSTNPTSINIGAGNDLNLSASFGGLNMSSWGDLTMFSLGTIKTTSRVEIGTNAVGDVPLTVKGMTGQTANLQNWYVNTTRMAYMTQTGAIVTKGTSIELGNGSSSGTFYQRGDGVNHASLNFEVQGDEYGGASMAVTNRTGANGVTFTLLPGDPAITLFDMIFAHPGGSSNLRLEGRSAETKMGTANEWQFGDPGGGPSHTGISSAGITQSSGFIEGTGTLYTQTGFTQRMASSTGAIRNVGHLQGAFANSTDATFKGRMVLKATDYGGDREGFRVEASGTAPLISFFGATAVVQQGGGALTAGGTYTANEQNMINKIWTALRNYGLLT